MYETAKKLLIQMKIKLLGPEPTFISSEKTYPFPGHMPGSLSEKVPINPGTRYRK